MDGAVYTNLTRQTGLLREMQVVANNIANLSTTGFRAEGVIFAEHVRRLEDGGGSLSMARAVGRHLDLTQGGLTQTGAPFDFAIEGAGFFLLDTPGGERLTRAGHFVPNAEGELVTPRGDRLLDAGGAPVFVPPDAEDIRLARDGTLSADGRPIAVLGLWQPETLADLEAQAGVQFAARSGVLPSEGVGAFLQGVLEQSNVNPIAQVTRMIEIQRSYEMGQGFLDREDERVRGALRVLGARA